jgi:integrase
MLGVVFVFAAAWCIELAIYHFSMKGAALQRSRHGFLHRAARRVCGAARSAGAPRAARLTPHHARHATRATPATRR